MGIARTAGAGQSPTSFWPQLAAVLFVATVLRFYQLGADEYWLDELHSLANSAGKRAEFEAFPYGEIFTERPRATDLDEHSTLAAVWRMMRYDTHPPLYFLLLNVWRKMFGDAEAATRSLSAFFSIAGIIPAALILRRSGRPRAGLFAALLLTVSFAHVQMGQQARQYSLAIFLTGCSFLALVTAEDRSLSAADRSIARRHPRRLAAWILYATTVYLSVLTHYFTVLALIGQAVYATARFRGTLLKGWVIATLAAGAGAAVTWGGVFLSQLDLIQRQPWLDDAAPGHVQRSILRLADLPVRLIVQSEPFRQSAGRSILGFAVVAGCLIILLRRQRSAEPEPIVGRLLRPEAEGEAPSKNHPGPGLSRSPRWAHLSRPALLFCGWFIAPALGLFVLDLIFTRQTLSHLRYAAVAVGGLAGILALTAVRLRLAPRWLLIAAVCIPAALSLRFPTTNNPDAATAVARLQNRLDPGDLIVFDAVGWPDWVQHFYAPIEYYMTDLPNPKLLLNEPPSEQVVAEIGVVKHVWVISPRVDVTPNPSPTTHTLAARSDYIWQVGWIYLFVRKTPHQG